MKRIAILALCFLSSLANANEPEEVVVTAQRIKIVLQKLSETHVQNPITGKWYYIEEKKEKRTKA